MQGIEIGASRVGNGQDGDLLVGILVAANIRELLGINWKKMGTSLEKEINWEISVDAFSWN